MWCYHNFSYSDLRQQVLLLYICSLIFVIQIDEELTGKKLWEMLWLCIMWLLGLCILTSFSFFIFHLFWIFFFLKILYSYELLPWVPCLSSFLHKNLDNIFQSLVVQLSGNIYPSCTVKMPSSISWLVC